MSIDGRQIHHSAIYLIENPKVSKIGKIFSAPANSAKRRLPRREAIVASYSLGYFLTAFDLTPDLSAHCHSHWKLVCSGSRCIEVSFETAPKITINCIVYSEYDNFLEIDSTPQILTDFNAIMLEQKTTVVCPLHPLLCFHKWRCCMRKKVVGYTHSGRYLHRSHVSLRFFSYLRTHGRISRHPQWTS